MRSKYSNFAQRIKSLFTQFDFIGPQFSFQNSDSCRFQSLQGSLWSLLAFALMTIVGYFFSKEIYERKEPITSSNRQNIPYSDIYFMEFPLMFSIITPSGKILNETNFKQYVTPFFTRQIYDNNKMLTVDEKINDFETCDYKKFTKFQDLVKNEILKHNDNRYLCLKFDKEDYFSNTFFSPNSTNYNIGLKMCTENCAEDLHEVVHGILIDISYLNSFVDMNNYNDPIDKYLEHVTNQLDLSLFRRSYMRFVYNSLSTDYGWITNNIKIEDFPYLESFVPDDLNWAYEGTYKNTLFIVSFESPKSKMIFIRSYLKVQQAMASLGGLSHALILMVRVLSDTHLKFVMYFFIRQAAISSLMKNDLENSISMNMKVKKQSNNNLHAGVSSFKPNETNIKHKHDNHNKPKNYNNHEDSVSSNMKLEKNMRIDENPVVQTVIQFNNEPNKNEKINNAEHQIKSGKKETKLDESILIREQLKIMRSKMSFFSPSAMINLKSSKGGDSFIDYIVALLCCRKEKLKYYKVQIKAIRKVISIHTYTNLIIKASNEDEYDIYDSLRVEK
jgi:hypothetical protein